MQLEPATVLEWKSCAVCNFAATCVLDGPIPDAEIGFTVNVAGIF